MTTPRSTRADAHSHLTPVSTPSPSSPAYPHPHTNPLLTCTSTRTRSRAVHLDPIAHQVIEWLLKRDLERCLAAPQAPRSAHSAPALRLLCTHSAPALQLRSKAEAASEREAHSFEKIDFDGRARACVGRAGRLGTLSPNPLSAPRPRRYAIVWGDSHRTKTIEECAQRCLEWKPQPPSMYACNIFVFCPLEKCYAPAALPPGPMTGQCWLKHQPDPNKPQVNMKGCRSKSRPAQLPCSPEHSLGGGATSAAYWKSS